MKTAVVFYSLEGNTRLAAQWLAGHLNADLLELKPRKPYPDKGFGKFFWGGKAATFQERPPLEPYTFDAKEYDRILLGTPLWAGTITPPLRTFLTQNDLSCKQVAAFVCCGGGKADKAFAALEALTGTALAGRCTLVNARADAAAAETALHALCETLSS